ncbi:MAG: YCF48-related protein [Salinisphaeraceae bacterium]|nr:YCF48-related protein [Salinisphaeraceae bacterium]
MNKKVVGLIAGLLFCFSAIANEAEEAEVGVGIGGLEEPGLVPALPAPKAAENQLLGITQVGEALVAVGKQGIILRSENGEVWQQKASPVSVMLTDVHFANAKLGFVIGYDSAILKTSDGGENWQLVNYDAKGSQLFDLLMLDEQRGIAVGGYGLQLVTSDGGDSWDRIENDLSDIGMHLNAVMRLNDTTDRLFVAGERGIMGLSEDVGQTWKVLDSPYGGSFFGAINKGVRGVLLYGMRGNVYSADDLDACATADAETWDPYERDIDPPAERIAELGWKKHVTPEKESMFGATITKKGEIVLVGINGTTFTMSRQGESIERVKTNLAETLTDIIEYKGRLLAVGRRGVQEMEIQR